MSFDIQNQILIKTYDQRAFPFHKLFSDFCSELFGSGELEQFHQLIPNPPELVRVGSDQNTFGHDVLYKIDPRFRPTGLTLQYKVRDRGFIATYQQFIAFLESEIFSERLAFQTLPTLRIQLPNNLSVGAYHRDRDYNHPIEEVNLWVPVTRAVGTATIQIEPIYGHGNHRPVEAALGQFVIFDSALEHGNEINREGYTRVSFDFRVIPLGRYQESAKTSFNEQRKFRIGDYYSLL